MARYNEILVGHFSRYLQKFTGIKGAVPTPTLAPEIFPFIPVFSGAENRYLGGWGLFANFTNLAGNAGTITGAQIRNPTGSNVVAVLLRFYFASSNLVGGQLFISNNRGGGTVADLSSSTPAASLDARSGLLNATCIVSGQNNPSVVNLNSIVGLFNLAVAQQEYDVITNVDQEIPLLPGDAYRAVVNANNQPLKVGFIWRERFLEESERT